MPIAASYLYQLPQHAFDMSNLLSFIFRFSLDVPSVLLYMRDSVASRRVASRWIETLAQQQTYRRHCRAKRCVLHVSYPRRICEANGSRIFLSSCSSCCIRAIDTTERSVPNATRAATTTVQSEENERTSALLPRNIQLSQSPEEPSSQTTSFRAFRNARQSVRRAITSASMEYTSIPHVASVHGMFPEERDYLEFHVRRSMQSDI